MPKKSGKIVTLFTLIFFNTFAFAEFPTPWSGTLPRPVLFVHGINATHTSWGVDTAQKVCNPTSAKLVNYTSYQNLLTPSKPLGHWFEFEVSCDDGSKQKYVKKFNTTSAGNTLDGELPNSALGNSGTTAAPTMVVFNDIEWYLLAGSDSYLTFYRLKNRPNIYDALCPRNVKTSIYANEAIAFWKNRPYAEITGSHLGGLVRKYGDKFVSPPALFASYYKMPADALKYNYPSDPSNTMINHNGLEFYCSTNPTTLLSDPFATIDQTNGTVWNSTLSKYEVGQTNQLYDRVSAVLSEYFSDWKTNGARQLDIVCHSQGCLVARNLFVKYRATDFANPVNHIKSLVILTSPQLGTAIATDNSGVPSASKLRIDVHSLYERGCLDKIPFTLDFGDMLGWLSFGVFDNNLMKYTFNFDVLKDVRDLAKNFISTDANLAYPVHYQNSNWLPPSSVITSGFTTDTRLTSLTTTIHQFGYPTRPVDGSKVPITAYYGTVPGIGNKILTTFKANGLAACTTPSIPIDAYNIKLSPDDVSYYVKGAVSSVLQNYQCPEITALISNKTCSELVNAVYGYLAPTLTQLDADWSPFSDLAVDLGSQQLLGSVSTSDGPIQVKPLMKKNAGDLGTPHATLPGLGEGGNDLLGATAHGLEVLYALEAYNGQTQAQVDANILANQPPPPVVPPPPPKSYVYVGGGVSPFGKKVAPFYIEKTEYTIDGSTTGTPLRMNISDALRHCNAKSLEMGLSPVYDLSGATYHGSEFLWYDNISEHLERNGYRLPNEDEWTLAYLAGIPASEKYFWGNNSTPSVVTKYAVYGNITNTFTAASKLPNSLGIYDMAGSFSEWVGPVSTSSSCFKTYGGSDASPVGEITYSSYKCSDPVFSNGPGHWLNIGLRMVRNAPYNMVPLYNLLLF